ncbi:MAG: response regulator [Pseudomonadota bacterium]
MAGADILIVEDNDLDVQILKRAFAKLDFQPNMLRAKDGVEALELLDCQDATGDLKWPFVILLDLNMPRMNGVEFLEKLRGWGRYRHVPVFVLTTSSYGRDVAEAYRLGANGYVVKPESLSEMHQTLQALIGYWRICLSPSELAPA